jgi:hypothetical protein
MWPFNRGWPLNGGPLNRGSTVLLCCLLLIMLFTIKLNYLLGCSNPFRGFDFQKYCKRIVSF